MPCRDYEDDVRTRTIEVDRPETVQLLCEAARRLADKNMPMSPSLKLWWTAHEKEDRLRIEAEEKRLDREKKRKAILAGLTKEEKEILGLR